MTVPAFRSILGVSAALALSVLVLVGRVAESIHAAQSNHAVCAAHGELLHVADQHAPAAHAAPVGPGVNPTAPDHGHEHCLLATLLWSGASPWSSDPQVTVPIDGDPVVVVACSTGERRALAPLCFAPKHSPPLCCA
ncbi:MAG: hypothetical protein JNL28_04605 [Planctomycetes bacterium]|nr:hypothetical protein [Planctomycetota bacterium]